MASITLKNVPDDLRLQMKARAAKHGRSLNQEILQCLRAAAPQETDIEAELAEVREFRARLAAKGVWLTEEQIEAGIHEGRR